MMAGDHNDIHEVAAFVNLLTSFAISRDGVALILHHPNKRDDDWLGSIAWHNKVRSRLIVKHSDIEGDNDGRVLQNPKANYGPSGGRIAFRWHRGAFVRDEDLPPDVRAELDDVIRANGEDAAFMRCLAALTAEKRAVSDSPSSPTYAPRVFAKMAEAKGITFDALERAMNRLFRNGAIKANQPLWKRPNRTWQGGIAAAQDPAQDRRTEPHNTPGQAIENTCTGVHAPHTPTTNVVEGAALEAAAPLDETDCPRCAGVGCSWCEADG